ncbi:MAG: hypothetical protein HN416_10625 [Nitrospina sp.]|nr:hypothetical protein [Nitrospina sp.]
MESTDSEWSPFVTDGKQIPYQEKFHIRKEILFAEQKGGQQLQKNLISDVQNLCQYPDQARTIPIVHLPFFISATLVKP